MTQMTHAHMLHLISNMVTDEIETVRAGYLTFLETFNEQEAVFPKDIDSIADMKLFIELTNHRSEDN